MARLAERRGAGCPRRRSGVRVVSHPRYPLALLVAFAAIWLLFAIDPVSPFYWWLENALVLPFVALLVATHRRFPLSNVSYTLILAFLVLHELGARYSYVHVPIRWEALGSQRNQYDRVVHFAFGLFLAYPVREVFLRVARARGLWGFYLPLELTLAFSAMYEILEWLSAVVFGGAASGDFVGAQGDEWDAVKDMACAGVGAFLAMAATFLIAWRHDPGFGDEMRASAGPGATPPLGEVRMDAWKRERAGKP
jgi:putative membrane protein